MIYLLIDKYLDGLEDLGLGFLRVFTYATFRSTIAIVLSFLISLLLGPWVIRKLREQRIADLAALGKTEEERRRDPKYGTPTMGGILIVASIVATTLLLADLGNFYIRMALVCGVWLAIVGAADDLLKLTVGRRQGSRQGLNGREKLAFQVGLAILLSYFTYQHGINIPECHTVYFPFFKNLQFDLSRATWAVPYTQVSLGLILFILITALFLTGISNAVNLTDGLDGLAGGCMGIVAFTFFLLALIVGTSTQVVFGSATGPRELARALYLPYIPTADEMAVIAGAITGACLGFLWFNCHPASVFMGDTGSLSLGGLIAYTAIVLRQELVFLIVGGIFVLEAASVLIQVFYFKYTRIRFGEGQRVFLMAPIHHHFRLKGWTETQVVVRFWLITAMLAALALASVKLR